MAHNTPLVLALLDMEIGDEVTMELSGDDVELTILQITEPEKAGG